MLIHNKSYYKIPYLHIFFFLLQDKKLLNIKLQQELLFFTEDNIVK